MPTIKSIPTTSQILNNWLKKISILRLHLRLWMWAAVKTDQFDYFEILITQVVEVNIHSSTYMNKLFVIEIALNNPNRYYITHPFVEMEFCDAHKLSYEETFGISGLF